MTSSSNPFPSGVGAIAIRLCDACGDFQAAMANGDVPLEWTVDKAFDMPGPVGLITVRSTFEATMASGQSKNQLADRVREELERYSRLLNSVQSALQIWEKHLTEDERLSLGGDLESCWRTKGTVGMWMELRGLSHLRAILELAKELDFLSDGNYRWLLREIGETVPEPHQRPIWNQALGELSYAGRIIRRVASRNRATNIGPILDAFEQQGWPDRIDDPLPGVPDPQRLREAIRNLNARLERIRFRADGTSRGIVWELADTRATPAQHP